MCEVSPDFISLLQADHSDLPVVVREDCGELAVWPPCTVTRQCGSAGASTAYHHQIITRSLHHHSQQIHVRSVRRLTLLTFSPRWIKLIKFDKLFIFVPPSPLPCLKRERERERESSWKLSSVRTGPESTQSAPGSFSPVDSQQTLLAD